MLLKIAIVLTLLYIMFLIFEYYYNLHARKKIKYVIHVNGTRGKSTVTRLIGTMLRKNNIKTWTKVTGTIPVIIDEEGNEQIIKRIGNANIKEQLKIIRKASRKNVEALAIECMAVTPKYQKITERQMLKSNIVVITNARKDHEEVMGAGKENIIKALGNTIPQNGILVIPNNLKASYKEKAKSLNTKIITYDKYIKNQDIDLYDENVAIAIAVGKLFNISEEDVLSSLVDYPRDIGAVKIFEKNNHVFISAFSINDNESLILTLDKIKSKVKDIQEMTILLNNRSDRQYRLKDQLELISTLNPKKVILAGSNYRYSKRFLNNKNIATIKYNRKMNLENYKVVLGMGNVKGLGLKLIIDYQEILN